MTRFRKFSSTEQRRPATNSRRGARGLKRKRRRHLFRLSKPAINQPPSQLSSPKSLPNPSRPLKSPPKKRKTWLWVLGWICIFPVPLTIIMLNKEDMSKKARYGIIAAGWILYLLIGLGGGGSK